MVSSIYLFECEVSFNILKPKAIAHIDAESAESVSGIATLEPNPIVHCIIHTTAAVMATKKVKTPIFTLAASKNAVLITSIDMGEITKKATET